MNTVWEFWLLGIALAIDCFSVSVASGIAARRVMAGPMTLMAIMFGLFQGGMTLLGYLGTSMFSSYLSSVDHWVAFGLLSYLGIRMICEGLKSNEEECENCMMLSLRNILTMSVATSIDALAVGISLACTEGEAGYSIMMPVSIIALCSFALSIVGLALGLGIGKVLNLHAEILGGVVLICIGVKILFEHL